MAIATQPRRASKWSRFFSSSVGRKYVTGATGVALVLFVIVHLLGNLTLLAGQEAFNSYAAFYKDLGLLLYVIEIGLFGFILLHALVGVLIYFRARSARPETYTTYRTVGGASRQTLSSRSMIVTGVVLFVFLVVHITMFRFGDAEGHAMGLYGIVVDTFSNPWWVIGYEAVMLLLFFHLRHGIWSALQSLTALRPKASPMIYAGAGVVAVLLGIGFLFLPLWIFFQSLSQ